MRKSSTIMTLILFALFSLSLFMTPTMPLKADGNSLGPSTDVSKDWPIKNTLMADYPDNYTHVRWNQSTTSEVFNESYQSSYWLYGPSITWKIINSTTSKVIRINDTIMINGWADYILKIPKNSLHGQTPYAVAFVGNVMDVSAAGELGPTSSSNKSGMFLALYIVKDGRWFIYSSQNSTFDGGPDGSGTTANGIAPDLPPDWTLEDMFGAPLNPFMEMNTNLSGWYIGPENLYTQFHLKFNSSTIPSIYSFHAVALDSSLMPIAESREDELSPRAVGLTFDQAVYLIAGGYYSLSRLDDDGNVVYSATRGQDFNITLNIKSPDFQNATIFFDLPSKILVNHTVDGPYTETVQYTGGWQYDVESGTYFWNESVVITHTIQKFGLHEELEEVWYDPVMPYQYYDPYDDMWYNAYAWGREAIIYWANNNTFDIRLVYEKMKYVWVDDPLGGYWTSVMYYDYFPFPADESVPMSYILNASTSSYSYADGMHVVNFRGHISDEMLPTGFDNPPLWVSETVCSTNKTMVPEAFLPTASSTDKNFYLSLNQLSVESPIAIVQLLHAGEPFSPSWMFATDRNETFTVKSRMQGSSALAQDVDGVLFQMSTYDEDWGFENGTDWYQHSQVDIDVKIAPTGEYDITVYNYTVRTAWKYGGHWEWQYAEVYEGSGIYEWQEIWVEDYYWSEEFWDFSIGNWSTEFVSWHANETIMPVTYLTISNISYSIIGNELRVLFDVTIDPNMPDSEWDWNFYYGNLTWVVDYKKGWGEHIVTSWVRENVYSYLNGTQHVYTRPPTKVYPMRNNVTDVLYPTKKEPYIILNGTKYLVQHYVQESIDYEQSGEEKIIFEEWDPTAYDPNTGAYSGNWVYFYKLLNGTKIPIKEGHKANVYNISLVSGQWFLSFSDYERYPEWAMGDGVMRSVDGTFIIMPSFEWNYTATKIKELPAKKIGLASMINGTKPIYMATEPYWVNDHYEFYVNGTWELVYVYYMYNATLGNDYYAFYNSTTGYIQWFFDGFWPWPLYSIDYSGNTYYAVETQIEFMAYTDITGTKNQLPYPNPTPDNTPYSIYDLNYVTPFDIQVQINGTWTEAIFRTNILDNQLGYEYPFYQAYPNGIEVNLTFYTYDPVTPWLPNQNDPYYQPWGTVANESLYLPEINHIGWSVAYGSRDPQTHEFLVDGWLNVSTGYYYSDYDRAIYDSVNGTLFVTTFEGDFFEYQTLDRVYFYNVTLANGTFFYSGEPWVQEYGLIETTPDGDEYYNLTYYYMYNTTGSMVRWYEWIDFTVNPIYAEDVNMTSTPQQYLFQGKWYNLTTYNMPYWDHQSHVWVDNFAYGVVWETYDALVSGNLTLEVVPLSEWNSELYNIPQYNFTVDNGLTYYNITGEPSMIYKAHKIWGYSKKLDYAPLQITVMRTQGSIVVGVPEWGMWDLQSWTIDPNNGAVDLDGNLETTDDQYYVRQGFESMDYYNITESYLWVSILWEPNASVVGDEFYAESYTGMQSINWTTDWAENYYWYKADTGALVNSTEWATINQTVFNSMGIPNPGYWGISWMARNFTFDDLKQQAKEEGWDWAIQDSVEWTWLWWNLYEHYGTEFVNGSQTEYVSVDVWYEYAGMFAWNDTNNNDLLDFDQYNTDSSEITHYWIPSGIDAISFTRPNSSLSGDEYWPVNASVPFGVSFQNVSGTVFPFGEFSYWDWYMGQYTNSSFSSFDERPTSASTETFDIGVTFTGNVTGTQNNQGSVKFNLTIGDWTVDSPGGRSVLDDRSLGVGFYSSVAMTSVNGSLLQTQFLDEYGQPASNNYTSQSSKFDVSLGSSEVASMNLGGAHYIWTKNPSLNTTIVDSQTIPYGAFMSAYTSDSGQSATSFTVTESHFYTLINFKWWDGYKVIVDPVFVGYSSSQGVDDNQKPSIDSIDTDVNFVNSKEQLDFTVTASDIGGSGIQEVKVMNVDTKENTTLTYQGDTGDWRGSVSMQGTDPYTLNYTIVAADYAGNENSTIVYHHTFWNDPEKPTISDLSVIKIDANYMKISVSVSDNVGGSGVKQVVVYLVNTETYVLMSYNATTGKYEATIARTSGMEYDLQYIIIAYDNADNYDQSSTLTYHFNDAIAPYLSVASTAQDVGTESETLLIEASVNDVGGSGLNSVQLTYTISSVSTTVDMTFNSETLQYEYIIPHQAPGTWVFYYVTATDGDGNIATSTEESYMFSTSGDTPPGLGEITISPTSPTSSDIVTVSVQILDDFGVKNATLYYRVNNGSWISIAMTADGNTYSAQIPAQADGSYVEFYIVAFDTIDQQTTSATGHYLVSDADTTSPQISSIGIDILNPTSSDTVTITATITDDIAIDNATLYYRVDSSDWIAVSMTAVGDQYSAQIPPQPEGSFVEYYIRAYDTSGNYIDSAINSYTVSGETTPPITSTTTTTPGETPETGGPLLTTIMLWFGGMMAIAVILIVVRMRK